ncbi:tripartite tricarboxylate transporter substrate-binding protein [Hydrogenophaga sp. BPS33]|uniref:tripartite tricarboxylate transporter substrate-binding protein n=1 Tax=Hydrogenophaga sp. BPS33 TaxID=2651974 RepID=UPI0013200FF5|nr:tripartite tricarboxylate transporter substrate-binding protein [Hydrogenophaga sp. BPS33]QHE86531.1 LysR family transcriptional regulator [Hydrogenophaga sp. BPS33]
MTIASQYVSLRQLRVLLSVGETGSFSATANAIGLTQSAVSQSLRTLEEALEIPLVDRTTRQVVLSDAGRRLVGPLREALDHLERVLSQAKTEASATRGVVRLACSQSVGGDFLPGRITAMQRAWPDIRLQLREQPHADVLEGVMRGTAELGLVVGDGLPSELSGTALLTEPYFVYCSLQHPFARRSYVSAASLRYEKLVLLDASAGGRFQLDRFLHTHDVATAEAQEVTQVAMAMALVSGQVGVAVLPGGDHATLARADGPGVKAIPLTPGFERTVSLVTRRNTALSPVVERAAGALVDPNGGTSTSSRQRTTLVVPFHSSGPADRFGRSFAVALAKVMGQPVDVENVIGLGGVLGVHRVTRSVADGCTIGLAGTGATVFDRLLNQDELFDVFSDITCLSGLVRIPNVLLVGKHVAASTLAELIAQVRLRPDGFTTAAIARGPLAVLPELFQKRTETRMLSRHYDGLVPAMVDLVRGRLDVLFAEVGGSVMDAIRSHAVQPLMIAGHDRAHGLPDVPTAPECGLPDVVADGGYCVVAPASFPASRQKALQAQIHAALRSPAIVEGFLSQGGTPDLRTGAEYIAYVRHEQERWAALLGKA